MSGDESQPSLQLRTQAFLQDFFAKGQKLVRELIEENEQLRARIAVGKRGAESDQLIARLTQQIERLEAECSEIRKQAGLVEQVGGYRSRLDALEQEHYQLAAMVVAGRQLQTSTSVNEVARTVTEILLNFVGVGQFTLYAVDEPRKVLFPLCRIGAEVRDADEVELATMDLPPESVPLTSAKALPRSLIPGSLLELPLRSGTRVVGLLRLERFLPQKVTFVDADLALLEIVADGAGSGLEMAWIRTHTKSQPLTRSGLEELVVA